MASTGSTVQIQDVVDYVCSMGDLEPITSVTGFVSVVSITLANDVMTDMLAPPLPWKFNRVKIPPFYLNSWQQDYAGLQKTPIAWLEGNGCFALDINNTSQPKPIIWQEVYNGLERTSYQFGTPCKVDWLPNEQLHQAAWPGPNVLYKDPQGQPSVPANPINNIRDVNANILVLTTYGLTGATAPQAPANSPAGTLVPDGSVVWTIADPNAPGFRVSPIPPQTGVVYQMHLTGQGPPPTLKKLTDYINPIPDTYSKYFRDGFIAYCTRHSPNPNVRKDFPLAKQNWIASMADARGSADRERTAAGFYPTRGITDQDWALPVGPAWPYGTGGVG